MLVVDHKYLAQDLENHNYNSYDAVVQQLFVVDIDPDHFGLVVGRTFEIAVIVEQVDEDILLVADLVLDEQNWHKQQLVQ